MATLLFCGYFPFCRFLQVLEMRKKVSLFKSRFPCRSSNGDGDPLFQNWWKWRGPRIFAKKVVGGKTNWRGGGIYKLYNIEVYWGFSGDLSRSSTGKKYWYLFFLNKHVLQNNCLNKTWDHSHCNSFNCW